MIHRSKKKNGQFYQMDKNIIEEKNLSSTAKTIMSYMLCQNDDWQFFMADIKNHMTDSLPQIRKAIKELTEWGLLERTKLRVNGKFVYEYDVYEQKPERQKPEKENEDL